MWKWSKASIISRLTTRFGLQEGKYTSQPLLDNKIVPITNLDGLLLKPAIKDSGNVATSGTGTYVMLTVPSDKRWILRYIDYFVNTGTITINGAAIYISTGAVTGMRFITSAARGQNCNGIVLERGWTLRLDVTVTGDGNIQLLALVDEEDSY